MILTDLLNTFAQEGSVQLSIDHKPHQHFIEKYSTCGCSRIAENQGDPRGWWPADARTQIDQILAMMMAEGPGGGHYENMLNPVYKKLGVGLINPGGALYFTNDFCN